MSEKTETQSPLRPAVIAVAVVGVLLTLGSLFVATSATLAVGIGALVAVLHLLAIAYWVGRALSGVGFSLSWLAVSLLKLGVLFAGLAWLAKSEVVALLPMLVGYGALPLGVVASTLSAQNGQGLPAEDESTRVSERGTTH